MLNLMYLIFLFFFICWFIWNVPKRSGETPFDESFVRSFIKRYGGNSLSHLLFLQDKQIYMAQNDSVMISYRQKGNKLFVLGDPIGEELCFEAGLDEFIDYASRMRAIPVFYQASERFLPFLQERGYRFFKVGEEARVCLDHFKIEGKKSAKIRTTRNKFLREGYQFSVIYPPFSTELIEELKAVSDEWLAERYEKSFSVSSFHEDYITLFPVSILRSPQGKLVAFASLPSDYKADESISIDLMRYTKAGSSGAMDMVFLSTIMWAKEKGFSSCSLGMSPLSNVGTEEGAPIPEKIARYVFLNGCKYYNFKGLRRYKAKFATDWMPRYLVYKKSFLLILIIHLMAMVRKQPRLKRNSFVRKLIRVKKAV
ncbi:phosphatidylglycerol lysyltransferase domain-containing protein [uncultured Metabacillus sp.]|uniref:phosphatidylglycerol lysyltransferase domain-containing protein n=1 Tax=uncultured Metabacillus sp. TaxID=2860135 RepID=UPI002629D6A0|nr:phosphatidylglycerol lysyltransferase domain-containing protein [uncultured Metabacillus sp.]